jgi:hypothetical protein
MHFTYPDIPAFKAWFAKDFPFAPTDAPDDLEKVTDADITKAMTEARANFNPALFGNQDAFATTFLYATAHYLIHDLKTAAQGVGGQYHWLSTSRSVGNVSESYALPEGLAKDPLLSFFATTGYGAKYLSLIMPLLVGNVQCYQGTTHP